MAKKHSKRDFSGSFRRPGFNAVILNDLVTQAVVAQALAVYKEHHDTLPESVNIRMRAFIKRYKEHKMNIFADQSLATFLRNMADGKYNLVTLTETDK